jgi:3-oxoacyl-[acyl-carrier-protein] synthase II
MNRVVVTGVGIVSPLGIGREAFWNAAVAGQSGIAEIRGFDASSFPVRIGGEVKHFDPSLVLQRFPEATGIRDRKVLLGLAAANEAITDAEVTPEMLLAAAVGVGVGLETICLEDLTPLAGSPDLSQAMTSSLDARSCERWLQTPLDRTADLLGRTFGFAAGRFTNCSACAAGSQVVGEAWQRIRRGQADVVLAGAADSMLNPLGLGGFSLLRVLSNENDTPQRACRPFDATRQGTVLGEGAAFLMIEKLEHALNRNASIYAEILGYGSSLDAFAVSDPAPDGSGAVLSMRRALRMAKLEPDDIDCVNAHGTGTPKNDATETAALKEVLGSRAYAIPVHSLKSMTGHMIAASGAVESVAAVLTLTHRQVPPTINLKTPDRDCDLDYVPNVARTFDGDVILSNSFGFGGQNATLFFRRYV